MTSLDDVWLVFTNAPDRTVADKIAHALVDESVAACVNILAPCVSVYRWQGVVETAEEIPLLIKTTRARYASVENLIQRLHPHELPEIIAVPLASGLPGYLQWVARETGGELREA